MEAEIKNSESLNIGYEPLKGKAVEISMKNYHIMKSGSVILLDNDYIHFNIGSLNFRFEIEYSKSEDKNTLKIGLKGESDAQCQCISFVNPTAGNGGAITTPIELAKINDKKVKLMFSNQAMGSDVEDKVNMLINYTWLLEK